MNSLSNVLWIRGVGVLCFLSANVWHPLSTSKFERSKPKAVERGASRSPSAPKPAMPGQQPSRPRGGEPQGTTASGARPGSARHSTTQRPRPPRPGPALPRLLLPAPSRRRAEAKSGFPRPRPAGRGGAAGQEARAERPGQSQRGEARARPCAPEHARTHTRTHAHTLREPAETLPPG